VIGLGYIGLPTSLLFARAGFEVIGVDIKEDLVKSINAGHIPSDEPGLSDLLDGVRGRFRAQTTVPNADVFVVCVPTPLSGAMRVADLTYVKKAVESVAPRLREGNLIIIESTVPPGTGDKLVIPTLVKHGADPFHLRVAHCPERAIPGRVLEEMTRNARVIGGNTPSAASMARDLYGSFVTGKICTTNLVTAEFIKLMENTYRDVNIALINEFAMIADECGVNVWEAREIANLHPRVNLLKPGPGVGGHCIAIDPWFLTEGSLNGHMISVAREVNDNMPNYVVGAAKSILKGQEGANITLLGVSYKANVGDTRETPAMKIARLAENEGYSVRCCDPLVKEFEYPLQDLESATDQTDCIVLVTDHEVFKEIAPCRLRARNRNLIDTRNFLDHDLWAQSGYRVTILGGGERSEEPPDGRSAAEEISGGTKALVKVFGGR